ncbi:hypothetical protein CPIN18021_0287 [Campylobacter pinnipediorum subsp. caledonicus]|uniref:Uncharacterized protein n=1 Tax=Campylobacter pinnipediorum subsp. caledonicus TaxID=1874362 RepID=A0A1S6U5X8_9BACT|nr:hypothetical protein [Campylobacter pinnipediorum]AQW85549.1 hypothetical protein CPIN18020_0308 [Campylobacter pinnipediorum subsp. caledonicus]AQW87134.1 hypothetical protein CPIN18021_0287 [Campylobacter pinnipediorum subsp. caledonicus]OPA71832.1 hypothetical protein BB381_06760 [Campylobacter pinnipediorum subsp. caledonicus]
MKKVLALFIGGIISIAVSIGAFYFFDVMFEDENTTFIAWLVSVGTYSAVLSPAKWLMIFKI